MKDDVGVNGRCVSCVVKVCYCMFVVWLLLLMWCDLVSSSGLMMSMICLFFSMVVLIMLVKVVICGLIGLIIILWLLLMWLVMMIISLLLFLMSKVKVELVLFVFGSGIGGGLFSRMCSGCSSSFWLLIFSVCCVRVWCVCLLCNWMMLLMRVEGMVYCCCL